ncbi:MULTISPECIES: hypothetical protein [Streptomyces]|uniref:DUF4232 domain-containing protein n=1 Tax=Streptomyces lienomycini TaxID=284035 RepID=A0ABV9WW35_9ACTN|nr:MULTISPECIES: hypothetical protein [Streptomyces]
MSDGNDARPDARPGHDAPDGQQQHNHTHAGNGTVNHGPDAQGPDSQGPDEQGPDAHGPDVQRHDAQGPDVQGHDAQGPVTPEPVTQGPVTAGPAADGPVTEESGTRRLGVRGLDGFDADEPALRAMMRHAVREMEPSDGTLEHLRRAVPARRARKRQAVVGAAAAALFLGTAVPALVHVSNSTGRGADPSVAGNASQAQGGASQGKDPAGGQSGIAGSAGTPEGKDKADPQATPGGKESGAATGSSPGTAPTASSPADVPACAPGALGPAVASSAAPDSTGVVYGTFRVTNVSSDGCTVTGPGTVVTASSGAADAARVGTARHAAGDAAAGLPDPSLEATSLTLAPGSAYEVGFAWVPSETCPTTGGTTGGGTGGPTSEPSPTGDTTAAGGTSAGGGEAGPTAQLMTGDGPDEGSVSVTYIPEGGSGSATATVTNACVGTVYWTGLLADTSA